MKIYLTKFQLGNPSLFPEKWEKPPKSHQLGLHSHGLSSHLSIKKVGFGIANKISLISRNPFCRQQILSTSNWQMAEQITVGSKISLSIQKKWCILSHLAKSYFGLTFQPHIQAKNRLFGNLISQACRELKNA